MEITKAKPLAGYRLELQFASGESGVVDLSEFVGRGVFAAWEQPSVFEQVIVTAEGAVDGRATLICVPMRFTCG